MLNIAQHILGFEETACAHCGQPFVHFEETDLCPNCVIEAEEQAAYRREEAEQAQSELEASLIESQ